MGLSLWAPDIDKVEKKFVSSENMLVYIQTRTSNKKMVHYGGGGDKNMHPILVEMGKNRV